MTVDNLAWKYELSRLGQGENINTAIHVRHLFDHFLGREPSLTEVYDFITRDGASSVNLTNATENNIISSLFSLTEFQKFNLKNSEYIDYLYQNILGRHGDAPGLKYWTALLDQSTDRGSIANAFLASQEFSTHTNYQHLLAAQDKEYSKIWRTDLRSISSGGNVDFVQHITHLYEAVLGRLPVAEELRSAESALRASSKYLNNNYITAVGEAELLNHFEHTTNFNSDEKTNASFVNNLYYNLLNRSADKSEVEFWLSRMNMGADKSAIFHAFITSNEFSAKTGYNHYSSQLASSLDVLWQDNSGSWIDTSPTSVNSQAIVIQQLKTLMGDRSDWKLVLDFDPEYSDAAMSNGSWTPTTIIPFLNSLKNAGLTPSQIIYHPDVTIGDENQWFPGQVLPAGDQASVNLKAFTNIAQWMIEFNKNIAENGLPQTYQLNAVLGEGSGGFLQKNSTDFTNLRNAFTQAGASKDLPIWFTADWHSDTSLGPVEGSPVNGVYAQLYDYWQEIGPTNPLIGQQTDPGQATTIGNELLSALGTHLSPLLFQTPLRTVLTLNFTGVLGDAPSFGPFNVSPPNKPYVKPGVTSPWDLQATSNLFDALKTQAGKLVSSGNSAPETAIWSIDTALDALYPLFPINPTQFSNPDNNNNKNPFYGAIVSNPLIFVSDQKGSVAINYSVNKESFKGIGLAKITNNLGYLQSENGSLIAPDDPQYSQLALNKAQKDGHWLSSITALKEATISKSVNWTVDPNSYYALVAQKNDNQIITSLGFDNKGAPWLANGIGAYNKILGIEGDGWSPMQGANFDEIRIQLVGLKSEIGAH